MKKYNFYIHDMKGWIVDLRQLGMQDPDPDPHESVTEHS